MMKELKRVGNSRAMFFSKDMLGLLGIENPDEGVEIHMMGAYMVVSRPGLQKDLEAQGYILKAVKPGG